MTIIHILFCGANTMLALWLRNTYPLLTLQCVALFFSIFFFAIYRKSPHIIIIFTIISLGISYSILFLATLIYFPILNLIYNSFTNKELLDILTTLIVGLIQIVVTGLIFRSNRLKSGLYFTGTKLTTDMGVFISFAILLSISIFLHQEDNYELNTILFAIVILFFVIAYLWIYRYIKNVYLERVNQQNIKVLNDKIDKKSSEIEDLTAENRKLSAIIHKDNKIIPALELAVTDLIRNYENMDKNSAEELIQQFKILTEERKGIVSGYEKSNIQIPKTDILSTDGVLMYLVKKASDIDCELSVVLNADIKPLFEKIIDANDFNTLLSDLGENAIIAVKSCPIKKILISLYITENVYRLDIFDSGIAFDSLSYEKVGLESVTTHKADGGSGIGLLTSFEILRKTKSSFRIDEVLDSSSYTKCVSVYFDNENRFYVHTDRADVIEICEKRSDITLK